MALLVLVSTLYWQKSGALDIAEAERRMAQEEQRIADEQRAIAEDQRRIAEEERRLAQEQLNRADREQGVAQNALAGQALAADQEVRLEAALRMIEDLLRRGVLRRDQIP